MGVTAAIAPLLTLGGRKRRPWADLLRRIYEVDPVTCPSCGAAMRIVTFITEPCVITKVLRHLAATGADPHSPPQGGAAAA